MSQWGEKIPEEKSTQKSQSTLTTDNYGEVITFDGVVNFQENSKRFVVEILTKNLALNFSGVLFFVGLGFSLKWWYKDTIFNTLLKQNLPALSEPQQEMSWETSEYVLKEQNQKFAKQIENIESKKKWEIPDKRVVQKFSRNLFDNESISYADERTVPHKLLELDQLDRLDLYANHVSIKFKSPWQKHAYQRFSGVFSKNTERKEQKGNRNKNSCSWSRKKYTVWEQPFLETWFKLSARGFYFLNKKPQSNQFNGNSFQSRIRLLKRNRNENFFSCFGKPVVSFLNFPFLGNTKKHVPTITHKKLDFLLLDTKLPELKTLFKNSNNLVYSKDILTSKKKCLSTLENCDLQSTTKKGLLFELENENHISTSIKNLSYPLQLTKTMFGWHPPMDALIFSSYLDEIPYKLESLFLTRSFDQTNKSNASFVEMDSKESVSVDKLDLPKIKEKATNQKRIASQRKVPNETNELFTTKEFKNETFLKKSQLFEIKQLLKKELQLLINTIPVDVVSENFPIEQKKFKVKGSNKTSNISEKLDDVVSNTKTFVNVDSRESKLKTNSDIPTTFERSKLEPLAFDTTKVLVLKNNANNTIGNNGIPSAGEIRPLTPALPPFTQTKHMMEQVTEEGKEKVLIVFTISEKNKEKNKELILDRLADSFLRDKMVNTTFDATERISKESKHLRNAENELTEKGKALSTYQKNESFYSLNLPNTFTFNNLSSITNPPILLPTNNDASFWMWKLFMRNPFLRTSVNSERIRRAPLLLKKKGGINQNSTLVFKTIGTNLVWEIFQQPSYDQHILSELKKKIPPKNLNQLQNLKSDNKNKIVVKQKRITVNNINDINPVDTKVDFVNSKARLMSGFVYPDMESGLLKTNLCQWLSKNIFDNMPSRGRLNLIPSFFYPKSSTAFRKVDRFLDKACLTNLRIPITSPTFLLRFFQQQVLKLENKKELQDWFPVQHYCPLPLICTSKGGKKIVRGGVPFFYIASQIRKPWERKKMECVTLQPVLPSEALLCNNIKDASNWQYCKDIGDTEMTGYAPMLSFGNKSKVTLEKRGIPLIGGVLNSVTISLKGKRPIKDKELFSKLKDVKSVSTKASFPFSNTHSLLPYEKFNHHLAFFPGFPKPGQFFLTLPQISQGNDSVAIVTPKNSVINKTRNKDEKGGITKGITSHFDINDGVLSLKSMEDSTHEIQQADNTAVIPEGEKSKKVVSKGTANRLEVDHLFSDCNTRKTAYNGIVVQRNKLTKDFQPFKGSLEQSSIWGTRFLGPENPLTNRQCHFFAQKQVSPLDTNSFQQDYLRQLGKEIVTQSNLKGFAEKLSSVERTKILSFSKRVNSFFFKKRKYTYLLKNKDQWHLLFQEQLRTALDDKRKYPPLTPEEKTETNLERIKVSAPLIMVRFPKEKKQTFEIPYVLASSKVCIPHLPIVLRNPEGERSKKMVSGVACEAGYTHIAPPSLMFDVSSVLPPSLLRTVCKEDGISTSGMEKNTINTFDGTGANGVDIASCAKQLLSKHSIQNEKEERVTRNNEKLELLLNERSKLQQNMFWRPFSYFKENLQYSPFENELPKRLVNQLYHPSLKTNVYQGTLSHFNFQSSYPVSQNPTTTLHTAYPEGRPSLMLLVHMLLTGAKQKDGTTITTFGGTGGTGAPPLRVAKHQGVCKTSTVLPHMHTIKDGSNTITTCSTGAKVVCKEDSIAQQVSESATQLNETQIKSKAGTKKLLPYLNVANNLQWLIQEPLTPNSWAVVSQWFFLVSVLCWIEQMLLENVFPSFFALEQILLGGKAGERNRVIRVSRGITPKFQDLAGIDGLLGELSQLVLFLRGQRSIGERLLNKKNSYGVLLTGPPGTGKTFLVRALANEAGVPVLILSAGTLVANKFNSNKPSWSIRHAFRRAKQLTPCILFIDEIDALGKSRGNIVTDINEIVADTTSPTFNVASHGVQSHTFGMQTFGVTDNVNQSITSSTFQAPEIEHSWQSWPPLPKGLINKWAYPLKSTLLQESNKISHYSLCDEKIIGLVNGGRSGTTTNEIPHLSTTEHNQAFSATGGASKAATRNTSEENIQGYNQEQSHNPSEAWNSFGGTNHTINNPVTTGEISKRKFGPLTQLLVSMDGVSNLSGILIMGATNRPELLDPALTRPGRFERTIRIEKPSEQKRIEILQLYSHNLGVQDQIPWSYFANRTRGLTAADLAVAMNYSSLKAIVQGSTHTVETIEYGLDSITRFSTTSFCRLSTKSDAWNSKRKGERK